MKLNYKKQILITLFLLFSFTSIFSQDDDNDGLTNTEETTGVDDPTTAANPNGTTTDPQDDDTDDDGIIDGNEYLGADGNPATTDGTDPNDVDTDNDGIQDGTEIGLVTPQGEDTDPSIFISDADPTTVTRPFDADTDDDGLMDGTEDTNGNGLVNSGERDPYNVDTDNDGIEDGTESGLDAPETIDTDPTIFIPDADPSTVTDPLDPDTDGDGVLDGTEDENGNGNDDESYGETDPYDPCDYLVSSVSVANTAGVDCDGDGVLDAQEMLVGTDPHDACEYNIAYVTQANIAGIDCDGDGVLDAQEMLDATDPHNPCDYMETSQIIANVNSVWQTLDCDGDGVTNGQEVIDGTDLSDLCNYILANQTITPSFSWESIDCDGDGVTNSQEVTDGTDPSDSCDYILASITLTPTVLCNGNTITGNVKFDYNTNGCDAADFPLSNVMVKSIDGSNIFATFTNISGDYIQYTNAGNFLTSVSSFSSLYTATPNEQSTTFVGAGNTDNIDFCVAPASTVNDLNITVIPMNNPVPNNTVSYQIIYKNVGSTIVSSGSVNFTYDDTKIVYQSSSSSPSTTTTNSVSYNYTNLNPYEIRIITVTFLVNSAAIGDILVFSAQIDSASDATPYDNTINFAQIVSATLANRSSNDTLNNNNVNDVLVLEGNQVELQHADEYLHYVIRYQNTNASPINDLIVTTELSDKLDWDTIQLEKQTHNGQVYILNGNQITFKFENINLAAGDQGYIAYRVKPKSDVVVGDVISNQANMYFDLNPVVTTSLISTTITNTAGVNNNNLITDVSIYPNPSKGFINIKVANDELTNVAVYSNLGQVVASFKGVDINTIDLSSLSKGIYFLKLTNKQGSTTVKKVVLK